MEKQKFIIQYLYRFETATTAEIFEAIPWNHYYYKKKHLGEILSRMVKNGSIERVRRGVYRLSKNGISKSLPVNENQTELF